jgi:glycosyltransferase involved in cell wall biosynthesis
MRAAYLTYDDVQHGRSYQAGTRYYIGHYLRNHFDQVDFLGPLPGIQNSLRQRLTRKWYHWQGERYLPIRSLPVRRYFAECITERLKGRNYDVLFAPDTISISELDGDLPVVFYTDAVFDQLVDYYPEFTHLCARSLKDGHEQEQAALRRASLAVYSSAWTADYVTSHFQVDVDNVHVIPFGANLEQEPQRIDPSQKSNSGPCRLFFLGKDWERKNGPLVLQITEILRRQGLDCTLAVCSLVPDAQLPVPGVEFMGLLDRRQASERAKLDQLFRESHYLVLPTRADCTPGAFREAAAYGLPVITSLSGGNASVVQQNESGLLLPQEAGAEEYAKAIHQNYSDRSAYMKLCQGARLKYETELNWQTAIARLTQLAEKAIKKT